MYLAPDGDEVEIANAAANFLAEAMPIARLHASDAADLGAPNCSCLAKWAGLRLLCR